LNNGRRAKRQRAYAPSRLAPNTKTLKGVSARWCKRGRGREARLRGGKRAPSVATSYAAAVVAVGGALGVRQAIEARGATLRHLPQILPRPRSDRDAVQQAQGRPAQGCRAHNFPPAPPHRPIRRDPHSPGCFELFQGTQTMREIDWNLL